MSALRIPMTKFGFDFDLLIKSWEDKLDGFRVVDDTLTPLEGGLGMGFDILREFDSTGWREQIPAKLLEITQPFPEYQYQMLWLAANEPTALEFLYQRPILLALICRHCNVDSKVAQILCRRGQLGALEALGLDATDGALSFIDKLELDFDVGDEYVHISRLLDANQKRYREFKDYPHVTYACLRLDSIFPEFSGKPLGLAMLNSGESQISPADFQKIYEVGKQLNIDNVLSVMSEQDSSLQLSTLYERWITLKRKGTHLSIV
ncbi:hypothetical protein [Vibrio neonatus]|uniref:hypothetical protein n=1 Tax=Vibrio neonatus TaxID=278860 RepID=UPI0021C2E239|nr:hypothetical protein [Vibrio neonatus]